MTEPPIHVRPEGVEPEPHKTGNRWVDLVLAGSAILISVVSLLIAVAHGRTQEKMVAAASWPVLFLDSGNRDDNGADVIALAVRNNGAGPALLKSVSIAYGGKRYDNAYDLLIACCGWKYITTQSDQEIYKVATNRLSRSVIPAGGSRAVLFVPLSTANASIWKRLDQARFKFSFDACYCSVLGECWRSDLQGGEPTHVKSCPTTEAFTR